MRWYPLIKEFANTTWRSHRISSREKALANSRNIPIKAIKKRNIIDGKLAELATITWLQTQGYTTTTLDLDPDNTEKWWDLKVEGKTCDVKSTSTNPPTWYVNHYQGPYWQWPDYFLFLSFVIGEKYQWRLRGWLSSTTISAKAPHRSSRDNHLKTWKLGLEDLQPFASLPISPLKK